MGTTVRPAGLARPSPNCTLRFTKPGFMRQTTGGGGSPTGQSSLAEKARMFERFTDRARKVMQLANQEAQRLNHEYIGTEHILLGLVKEGSGVAANVLKNLDVDLRKIRLEVEKIAQTGSGGDRA